MEFSDGPRAQALLVQRLPMAGGVPSVRLSQLRGRLEELAAPGPLDD